jgi:hypothetical protein
MKRYARACWFLVGCAIATCQPMADAQPRRGGAADPERPAKPDPDAPRERFERDMMMRFHMHASFDLARAIERVLIRGKLEDARPLASSLAGAAEPPGLAPWATQLALVRARAQAVATAPGIDEACRRAAQLAEACARCHVDVRAQAEFQPPSAAPADRDTVPARMARHQWAVDRIWEGMVGNADDAWIAGLDVLAATPLPWPKLGSERAALAGRLQRLASQAKRVPATGLEDRTRIYGEILVTCAACHAPAAR